MVRALAKIQRVPRLLSLLLSLASLPMHLLQPHAITVSILGSRGVSFVLSPLTHTTSSIVETVCRRRQSQTKMQLLQKNARPVAAGQRATRKAPRMSVVRSAAVAEKTLVTTKSDEVSSG